MDDGIEGSCSDAHIFTDSELKDRIEDESIGFPEVSPIEPDRPDLPYFILADDAFTLKTWLIKPYSKTDMNRADMVTKYRISRGRRVVENAFAILSSQFRVFHEEILVHPDKMKDIVLGCVKLHKLRAERDAGGWERDLEDEKIPNTGTSTTVPWNRETT